MKITVNGESKEIEKSISITELLQLNEVKSPELVTVELNEEIVDKENYETTMVEEGAVVEFLYFMGGGQILVIDQDLAEKSNN